MNLKFTKKDEIIITKIVKDGKEEEFEYLSFIKYLLEENKFDGSEFDGEFSDLEKNKVKEMVNEINEAVKKKEN